MAGRSKAEIVSAMKAAFAKKELPDLENGAMAFMMSKSAYLFDAGDHNGPHVMFFTALEDGRDWGAGASGSPVFAGPYWFLSCINTAPTFLHKKIEDVREVGTSKSIDRCTKLMTTFRSPPPRRSARSDETPHHAAEQRRPNLTRRDRDGRERVSARISYSVRNASRGLRRAPRRAGSQHATSATVNNRTVVAANTTGSRALTP
jgi:hypothetical protein